MKKQNNSNNTLFNENFPEITTNKELEKVKKKYGKELDEYYLTSGCVKDRREIFKKLWQKYKPYADRHFLSEVKLQFHQRTWKMFLGVFLLENGLDLTSQNEGPDFILNDSIYIECIAVTKGDKNSRYKVPEFKYGTSYWEPEPEKILRITQAINDKFLKYKEKWTKKPWFDNTKPFVIALNVGDLNINESYNNSEPPYIAKALFGIGNPYMAIDLSIESSESPIEMELRPNINKGKTKINSAIFSDDSFSEISGIIYYDKMILNANMDDTILYIPNPFAKNRIKESELDFLTILKQKKISDKYYSLVYQKE